MQHFDFAGLFAHECFQDSGERATHPIEPHFGTLAALLSQGTEALAFARHKQSLGLFVSGLSHAGKGLQRPAQAKRRARLRLALPAHRIAAHSGASHCGF